MLEAHVVQHLLRLLLPYELLYLHTLLACKLQFLEQGPAWYKTLLCAERNARQQSGCKEY